MNPRIPQLIQPVLENYLQLVNEHVPKLIDGFYIVGSIALDEFNEKFSDIDFVAVLSHKATEMETRELDRIHKTIRHNFPDWKLEGCYFQYKDLGCLGADLEAYPYYQDGKLAVGNHFEANSVTWWTLKNHGIAIIGDPARDLNFTVDWNVLIDRMKENLNSYWLSWTKRVDHRLRLLSDWGIQWAVLGVLRQYYTFKENSITTKVRAGGFGLNNLPAQWHPIIQEAINIRIGKKSFNYRSRIVRMKDASVF